MRSRLTTAAAVLSALLAVLSALAWATHRQATDSARYDGRTRTYVFALRPGGAYVAIATFDEPNPVRSFRLKRTPISARPRRDRFLGGDWGYVEAGTPTATMPRTIYAAYVLLPYWWLLLGASVVPGWAVCRR